MAPRSKERSGSAPLSDREKVLIGLLALTWVSIPLLLMHAGLDSHPARHENLLSTRRALVEPAAAPVLSPPPPPTPSPPLQVVDTSTTTLYHLFSVPVLASLEDIPEEDLDEVARIVLEEYHEIEKKIKVPGLEGHNEQINNDFFSWQNDVGAPVPCARTRKTYPPWRVTSHISRLADALAVLSVVSRWRLGAGPVELP